MKNQPSPTSLSTFCPETIPASDRQVKVLNWLGSTNSHLTTIDPKAPTGPSSTLQHSASESATALVSTSVDEQSCSSSVDDLSDFSEDTDSHVNSFYHLSLTTVLTTLPVHRQRSDTWWVPGRNTLTTYSSHLVAS